MVVQSKQATFMEVKQALRKEGIRYSLMKIMLEDNIHFFQEPDETWAWLEMYHSGTDGAKNTEHKPPRHRGKRRHTLDPAEKKRATKPT
ncbi:hypothetical protein NDU88_003061 [Pleurodeles waltl]|uniref:Uncharacterized protein n=1 Tax=Pleurodeles waltl TaxID=8319 RepID=A0AAV7VG57_PLEWA|nr:hypothetical protein NDU88_003061 [Pleurodeles waltl]